MEHSVQIKFFCLATTSVAIIFIQVDLNQSSILQHTIGDPWTVNTNRVSSPLDFREIGGCTSILFDQLNLFVGVGLVVDLPFKELLCVLPHLHITEASRPLGAVVVLVRHFLSFRKSQPPSDTCSDDKAAEDEEDDQNNHQDEHPIVPLAVIGSCPQRPDVGQRCCLTQADRQGFSIRLRQGQAEGRRECGGQRAAPTATSTSVPATPATTFPATPATSVAASTRSRSGRWKRLGE